MEFMCDPDCDCPDNDSFHSLPRSASYSSIISSDSDVWLLGFENNLTIIEKMANNEQSDSEVKTNTKRKRSESNLIDANSDQLSDKITTAVVKALTSSEVVGVLRAVLLPDILSALKTHWDEKVEALEAKFSVLESAVAKITALESTVAKQGDMLRVADQECNKSKIQNEMSTTGKLNNLLITGIEEKENEDLQEVIKTMINKLEVAVDSFNAKRVGQKRENKNRSILVSMNNHWDKRKLYAARMKLRQKGMASTFINEDLFKLQSEIFFYARKAKQDKTIKTTWTTNGSVFIKTNSGVDFLVRSIEDIKSAVPNFDIDKHKK